MGQSGDLIDGGGQEVPRLHPHLGQQLRDQALFLLAQGGKQVFLLDGLVLIFHRQTLGGLDGLHGLLGALIDVHRANLLHSLRCDLLANERLKCFPFQCGRRAMVSFLYFPWWNPPAALFPVLN